MLKCDTTTTAVTPGDSAGRIRRLHFMTEKTVRHYLQFKDFSLDDYDYVLERARILKRKFKNYETYHPLHDRTLAMIFEKNSTRTRLSFEAGFFSSAAMPSS